MTTVYKDILFEDVEEGIVVLTLNRPEVRNAAGLEMAADVIAACTEINGRSDVRAVILTGAGDKGSLLASCTRL